MGRKGRESVKLGDYRSRICDRLGKLRKKGAEEKEDMRKGRQEKHKKRKLRES